MFISEDEKTFVPPLLCFKVKQQSLKHILASYCTNICEQSKSTTYLYYKSTSSISLSLLSLWSKSYLKHEFSSVVTGNRIKKGDLYGNPYEVERMQPMWQCIFWCKQFEETFKNTQWRKVKQMQPVRLCILTGRQLKKDTQ